MPALISLRAEVLVACMSAGHSAYAINAAMQTGAKSGVPGREGPEFDGPAFSSGISVVGAA